LRRVSDGVAPVICADESEVDWLLAYRVDLSSERVKSITRLVEEA
jgi:hypothetical protein